MPNRFSEALDRWRHRHDAAAADFTQALSRLSGRPLAAGNRVQLLRDGPQAHQVQIEAIANAQHHVHLETYLLSEGEIAERYARVLTERAQAGVRVRVMIDGIGALGAGNDYRQRLLDAGIELREFNPVNPFKNPRLWRMTRRTHRKTLVVDGRLAFTGGINITDDYCRGPLDTPAEPDAKPGWRDTHVAIEGPAAADFQRVFLTYWSRLGVMHGSDNDYPAIPASGDCQVCALTDQGEDFLADREDDELPRPSNPLRPKYRVEPNIYRAYLDAMRRARKRVWITQAYFAPTGRFIRGLTAAARRGVDVRLILPARTDASLLKYAARQRYARLMRAGVHVYEYQPAVLHAKTALVDGIWSTIGSANLDYRSFFHNDEGNAFIICPDIAAQMKAMFEDDLRHCQRIDPERWSRRGWRQRLLETIAGSLRFLL